MNVHSLWISQNYQSHINRPRLSFSLFYNKEQKVKNNLRIYNNPYGKVIYDTYKKWHICRHICRLRHICQHIWRKVYETYIFIYENICVKIYVTHTTYMKLAYFIYVKIYELYMTHIYGLYEAIYGKIYELYMTNICSLYVAIYVKIYDAYMQNACHIHAAYV